MSGKRSPTIIFALILCVLLVLLAWPRIFNPNKEIIAKWGAAGIRCLAGHVNLSQHIHPELVIRVDGVLEGIPANQGIVDGCMAEIHTHDASGTIHLETIDAFKTFQLHDFLFIAGKSLERDGYDLKMTVDGKTNEEFGNLIMKDKQKIVLEYIKIK